MVNDFNEDLAYSFSGDINNFYRRIFPVKKIEEVTDRQVQYRGIDKILYLEGGKELKIEEKRRRTDYGDILLEVYSNRETKRLGWLYTSQSDYISYRVEGAPDKVFLLPMALLQAWVKKNSVYFSNCRLILAKNKGYTTESRAVPIRELKIGLNNLMFFGVLEK